jgi:hypothetical protein
MQEMKKWRNTALFQEKNKPEYFEHVFSLTGSFMSLAMPLGLILSGFFADRIVTTNYQTGHPHGYISAMYRGELAISKILYAKNESLCKLKKQAETYPSALRKSLVDFFMFEAGFSLMFVKANLRADDKYYIAGHVFRIISCLNQVLFACNNAYCINEKKAVKMIETFEHKPGKYAQKVNGIFEVLGLSLIECYDMTEKLYYEVKQF